MVQPELVQRGEGDGSREQIDDKYDGEEYVAKEPHPPTNTTFYKQDVERLEISARRKRRLRRMRKRQEGKNPGEVYYQGRKDYTQQNRDEWKRRMISTFASQLELTKAQKQRVKHLMNDVLSINSFGIFSTEQVTLGVINVVARQDGRWIEDEEQFRELMEYADITDGNNPDLDKLRTLRGMVRDRISD